MIWVSVFEKTERSCWFHSRILIMKCCESERGSLVWSADCEKSAQTPSDLDRRLLDTSEQPARLTLPFLKELKKWTQKCHRLQRATDKQQAHDLRRQALPKPAHHDRVFCGYCPATHAILLGMQGFRIDIVVALYESRTAMATLLRCGLGVCRPRWACTRAKLRYTS